MSSNVQQQEMMTTNKNAPGTAEVLDSRTSRTCRCLSSSLSLVATWDPWRRNVHIQVGRQNCGDLHRCENTVWWRSVRFCSETPHLCEVEFYWLHCWLHFFTFFVSLNTLTCADGRTWPDVKHFVGEELVTCKNNGDLVTPCLFYSPCHVCFICLSLMFIIVSCLLCLSLMVIIV